MSTSSENTSELRALVKLISGGVENIIAEYESAGQDVPSVHSVTHGLFDERDNLDIRLKTAMKTVSGACGQLVATVETPGFTLFSRALSYYDASCLNVALTAKIPDLLTGHRDGLALSELAKQTGLDKDKLRRVLRYLAAQHIFREVSTDIFANNRLSHALQSKYPISSLVELSTDELFVASTKFSDVLKDPEFGSSQPVDRTAFSKAWGCNVYAFYNSDEGRERGKRFNKGMMGTTAVSGADQLLRVFPWGEFPKGTRLCDVGGGKGHIALGILKASPHLRVIVQDLPDVISDAKEFWQTAMPEALENNQVDFAAIDFLKESPVKGCDICYVTHHDRHNWPDDECVKILSNVRQVMEPDNRLLIHDWVIQPLLRQSLPLQNETPEPLLANYGMGGLGLFIQDINVMFAVNAKERTLAEFKELGRRASLEFVKYMRATVD